jgi:hypothetical protein
MNVAGIMVQTRILCVKAHAFNPGVYSSQDLDQVAEVIKVDTGLSI